MSHDLKNKLANIIQIGDSNISNKIKMKINKPTILLNWRC